MTFLLKIHFSLFSTSIRYNTPITRDRGIFIMEYYMTDERIAEYLKALENEERATATIEKYRRALLNFAVFLSGAAVTQEMIRLWTEALEDVRDNDDVYALLLSGNGKAFCAGGDVKAMAAGDGFFESHEDISSTALARKNSLWKGIQRIPLLLEEIDKPVVAKIHGAAVGAGLDMALMCDVRIAGESASMSESYFNAGIVPGDGGAYFLPRLVGRDKALDLFWTARTLKGKEAADMGLVTHCVPDAELDAFVEQYMEKLLAAPQQAMRLTKRAVVQGEQSSLRASLDLISSFMGIVTELDDYRQRTSALVAKMQRKAQ